MRSFAGEVPAVGWCLGLGVGLGLGLGVGVRVTSTAGAPTRSQADACDARPCGSEGAGAHAAHREEAGSPELA